MKRFPAVILLIVSLAIGCSTFSTSPSPTPTSADTPTPIPPTSTPQPTPTDTPSPTPTLLHDSALSFDGKDDYVLVVDDPSLDMTNGYTIAAWIYLDGYSEWASLVTKGNNPDINNYTIHQSGPRGPLYFTEFGKLRVTGCTELPDTPPESKTVLSLQKWHFVAVTFNGLRISYFLNGEPDGFIDFRGPLCTNDEPLHIGVDFPGTSEYWHGAIDELRIWNLPLSGNQLREVMTGGGQHL
jgi:trimeric autotransporter adhesin